jgi:hypothetical protein
MKNINNQEKEKFIESFESSLLDFLQNIDETNIMTRINRIMYQTQTLTSETIKEILTEHIGIQVSNQETENHNKEKLKNIILENIHKKYPVIIKEIKTNKE